MGFNAVEKVANLDYNFGGITVADEDDQELLDNARGTTPEPTTRQVRRMNAGLAELVGLPIGTDPAEVIKALAEMSEDQLVELDADQLDIMAELTAGSPSRDELAALPFRHRQAYYGWLIGEINNPSVGSSGTRRTLAPVKNA